MTFIPSYGDTGWFGASRILKATCPRCQREVYWGPCDNCDGTQWKKHERRVSPGWALVINYEIDGFECTNCGEGWEAWTCQCGCSVHARFFCGRSVRLF